MEFELFVSPKSFSLDQLPEVKFELRVKNISESNIDTEAHLFNLEVNEVLDPNFSFRMGNGIRENKWFDLPQKETIAQDLGDIKSSIFKSAGDYSLTLWWKENKTKTQIITINS